MANLVACQMISSPNVSDNLQTVEDLIKEVPSGSLVVLPECFACFGAGDSALLNISEEKHNGPIQQRLSELSKHYCVWIVAGTMPLKTPNSQKYSASCLVFDDQGNCVTEYQKIHLFDVNVDDATGTYQESKFTQAGTELVVINSPFGRIGLAVCYDLRFAGLFQAMGEIDILTLPSAFTRKTGEAHWHSLLAARAIEKQCYVIAANQGGVHVNRRETYGHSCIISPWGVKLAEIDLGVGTVSATLDNQELAKIRQAMPVQQHNKFRSYLV